MPQTILAVDDNEATRYLVARMLRRAGFEVLEATTGAEALQKLDTRPDLVILDIRLPDISGLEVCRRIKQAPATHAIPVLHLSASFTEGVDKAHGLDGGADGYLTHPVEAPELLATVRALLRARDAEELAHDAARQWQATFDAIGDAVCLAGRDGVVRRANLALGRLARHSVARCVGRPLVELLEEALGPFDGEDAGVLRDALAHGDVLDREVALGGRWYRLTTSPVHGSAGGVVCVLEDVTLRHRHEAEQRFVIDVSSALQASLDHRATLATFARHAVPFLGDLCVVDVEGLDEEIERVAVAGGPCTDESARAHALERLRATPATVRERDAGAYERVRRDARPVLVGGSPDEVLRVLAPAIDPEGLRTLRPRAALLVPLLARGRVLGVATFCSDDPQFYANGTREVAFEVAARAALAADNARLYEQALAANHAKADFLAVMSHELRTPLNAILGYADLMTFGIAGPVTDDQHQHLGRIKLSGRHLLALIDEVLTFSRLEAGKEAALIEVVDVCRLASESAALVEPLIAAKGLTLDLRLPGACLSTRTDARKLRQILVNLLSNAVKFTDRGTITLQVSDGGARVNLEVTDTGIGIAPEHLGHIFDPFWQVEQTVLTRRAGGTGLGLSVVRRLTRMLGGDVNVRSTPGQGSTFSMWLPRAEETTGYQGAERRRQKA